MAHNPEELETAFNQILPWQNGKAQKPDKDESPIPRHHTAGELGSFFGFLYPGGSNILEAVAFGRIAGLNATTEKPWA